MHRHLNLHKSMWNPGFLVFPFIYVNHWKKWDVFSFVYAPYFVCYCTQSFFSDEIWHCSSTARAHKHSSSYWSNLISFQIRYQCYSFRKFFYNQKIGLIVLVLCSFSNMYSHINQKITLWYNNGLYCSEIKHKL